LISEAGPEDEVDYHLKFFGKRASEVVYSSEDICPICNSRIDEFGWCACDTLGGG
jgi:hypothetical protein